MKMTSSVERVHQMAHTIRCCCDADNWAVRNTRPAIHTQGCYWLERADLAMHNSSSKSPATCLRLASTVPGLSIPKSFFHSL